MALQEKKIFKNAFVSVLQVGVSGVTLFILYRYLLLHLGVEKFGVWSVVLATASVSRLSEMGLSGSVVKFIAKYISLNNPQKVDSVIQTAVLSLSCFLGFVFLILYYPLTLVLSHVIPEEFLQIATQLLPLALLVLWIMSVAGVYQSGLEGHQRNDLRGIAIMIASIIYLILAILLTKPYGLLGLAYAQVAQALVVIILSVFFLKKEMEHLTLIPREWNKETFQELFRYGIAFQAGAVFLMLFEPATKILLSNYGGVSMVGYFEMANRMVQQFRFILISANQVLVPVFAGIFEKSIQDVYNVYKKSFSVISYLSLPFFGILSIAVPFISKVWVGTYEPFFVLLSYLMIASWYINTLVTPAYFANMGIGTIKWNTLTHVAMGTSNIILGLLLGSLLGGMGVIIAYLISLIGASLLLVYKFHQINAIPLGQLIPRADIRMLLINVSGLIVFWLYGQITANCFADMLSLIIVSVFIIVVFFLIPMGYHPMSKKIYNVITNR